ncbi:MAG: transposase [Gemmatimonadales bacterium]
MTPGLAVPPRVPAEVKEGLLKLVDDAIEQGFTHAWACRRLELSRVRAARWRWRLRKVGTLTDRAPGGVAVHALLPWEVDAILELVECWAPVDRSHRKLAHRGSYLGKVFVSPATVRRVLAAQGIELAEPPRPPHAAFLPPWPDWVLWRPNQIWIWDATAFPRARRVCYAIVDVVSRKWIGHLLTADESSTPVRPLFAEALEREGILELLTPERLDLERDDPRRPVLLAWSDNGPQMISGSTREYMALLAIWQYHGRPGRPTDQAHVESFFGHVKVEWPHLLDIRDPVVLEAELHRIRGEYNGVRLHASIGYVTPDDEHEGRGPAIRRARVRGLSAARQARIHTNRQSRSESRDA